MRILFVAPGETGLNTGTELARIAAGNQLEICDSAVDRGKLEAFLGNRMFDVIHFSQHGNRNGLVFSDGLLEVADLTSMLERQTQLKLLVVNACDSVATGISLHNAFHVPVVAHDAPITDAAAVAFSEVFYRALRNPQVAISVAFERALHTLQVRFANDARTPQLINGDMADKKCLLELRQEIASGFDHFNARLDALEVMMDGLNDSRGRTMQLMIVYLLVALLIAQALTPLLNRLLLR